MTATKGLAMSQAFPAQRKARLNTDFSGAFLSFRIEKQEPPGCTIFDAIFFCPQKPIAGPLTSHMSKMALIIRLQATLALDLNSTSYLPSSKSQRIFHNIDRANYATKTSTKFTQLSTNIAQSPEEDSLWKCIPTQSTRTFLHLSRR
jgi:hypothetical protein